MHHEETEGVTLTCSRASSWWHVTAFRLASIKYLCVRLRSRSSFFSKASWDVDKLSKYFIMTSDIMELTSTISGRASASGVRHLREDELITTVRSKSGAGHGVGRVKVKFYCVSTPTFARRRIWGKMDSKHSFESKTSRKAFGKFGKEREAALFSATELAGKDDRLSMKLLLGSQDRWMGLSSPVWISYFLKSLPTDWSVKQRGIPMI